MGLGEPCGFRKEGRSSIRRPRRMPPKMPSTHEALIEFFARTSGDPGAAPAMLVAHLRRLDAIVQALKASPLAPGIRIFGSATRRDGMVPGDIDAFVAVPEGLAPAVRKAAFDALLRLTEGDNHGLFDPFRLMRPAGVAESVLVTRGPAREANRWVKAEPATAAAIERAGRAGIPVAEFGRRFVAEFAPAEEPVALPTP